MPIIGADFLKHFNLLVDVHHKRLVNAVTQLKGQGISSKHTSLNLVWQLIKRKTEFETALTEFPSITQLKTLDHTIKHNVTHYIKTDGPPVHSRACRLAPEKLKLARQEFEHIL